MMPQLLLHMWGDYLTQSDWMANEKTKRFIPAADEESVARISKSNKATEKAML